MGTYGERRHIVVKSAARSAVLHFSWSIPERQGVVPALPADCAV